jgi:hypothetical protein
MKASKRALPVELAVEEGAAMHSTSQMICSSEVAEEEREGEERERREREA